MGIVDNILRMQASQLFQSEAEFYGLAKESIPFTSAEHDNSSIEKATTQE